MNLSTINSGLDKVRQFMKPLRFYLLLFLLMVIGVFFLRGTKKVGPETYTVLHQTVKLKSSDEVVAVKSSYVKPILYTNLSGLDKIPVGRAKSRFIAAVLPAVLVARHQIEQRKIRISWLQHQEIWTTEDSVFFNDMKARYRAKDLSDLLDRMITLPNSLVLAQAAVESGWGKSRFFLAGNNLFGVWSYNVNEPRIPALIARKERRTYLRSYSDMSESIVHYHEILARSRSYKGLREARKETNDPIILVDHLKNFSEKRSAYTHQLRKMIVRNKLTQFDHYEIDPAYLRRDE